MTNQEAILLKFLTDYGFDIFTKEQIVDKVEMNAINLGNTLYNLTKKGNLIRLEKGKYCVYGFSDVNVIACFIAHNSCVSYWTSMNYHGLTEQIPNVVFVQTDKQKTDKIINGVHYRFVWLHSHKIFGYKTLGFGNHEFKIADIEKTLIDCFDMPRYSGGYPEIIKAFYNAKLNSTKLIAYCKKMGNISLAKRLGYLADLFDKKELEPFIDYAQKIKNKKYNLFEIGGNNFGKINKKWGLVLNLDKEEIINMATI